MRAGCTGMPHWADGDHNCTWEVGTGATLGPAGAPIGVGIRVPTATGTEDGEMGWVLITTNGTIARPMHSDCELCRVREGF